MTKSEEHFLTFLEKGIYFNIPASAWNKHVQSVKIKDPVGI
jgi:hypothetical protein